MISFIIPTRDEEKALARTLQAIKKIREFDYEIIISDDASRDRTVEIAKQFTDKILLYTWKKKRTIAHVKNAGAKVARGEYFIFMDADVEIRNPDIFLEKATEKFKKDPELNGISVFIQVFPEIETRTDKIVLFLMNAYYLVTNAFGIGGSSGAFQMVRADAFRNIGGFREGLVATEDVDLFSRLSKTGRTRICGNLHVYETGRRAHKIGWPKLLLQWAMNSCAWFFLKQSASKEWEVIR